MRIRASTAATISWRRLPIVRTIILPITSDSHSKSQQRKNRQMTMMVTDKKEFQFLCPPRAFHFAVTSAHMASVQPKSSQSAATTSAPR
jgi:hypothetical protein